MTSRDRLRELLQRYVEGDLSGGVTPTPEELCEAEPGLLDRLRRHVEAYERLSEALEAPARLASAVAVGEGEGDAALDEPLPVVAGFRTVERLGSGGGGEVFKLEDLDLGRPVAAKFLRDSGPLGNSVDDFLREARAMALFADPRIARLLEFRREGTQPVLLMEYVDGFELDEIGPSLEYSQRARLVAEIADAVEHAHSLGVQHRDLKPANILVDSSLVPRILDFGLSEADPSRGHLRGTLSYMAPEQLDRSRPIDERSDVYALGVVLYELLCGSRPFAGADDAELMERIASGEPPLPLEIDPDVPEPLQAIALKAMERDPAARYPSAREMALELRRYLEGRPVVARPTVYQSALARRLRPHMEQIREWLRLKLIYPHEARPLRAAYQRLEEREEDWIVQSRSLSLSKIALYLGAFLLSGGGLLYFEAYRAGSVDGLAGPLLALGLPLVALNAAALGLYRREQKAAAVAFCLGGMLVLLLLALILLVELELWPIDPESPRQLFRDGMMSNRQLQLAALVASAWAFFLGLRTGTVALASAFTGLAVAFYLAVLGDLGLRAWIDDGRWDIVALHLAPLTIAAGLCGRLMERRGRASFGLPLYLAAAGLYFVVLELSALNGRTFYYLGLSAAPLQPAEVADPLLLDTIIAMTVNGVLIYGAAALVERRGSQLMEPAARMLFAASPFAILKPLLYLSQVGEYSRRYDWIYLALAVVIAFLSHYQQRRSFYYAGLINTAVALWLITDHYGWWNRPGWGVAVVLTALAVLATGWALGLRERARPLGSSEIDTASGSP